MKCRACSADVDASEFLCSACGAPVIEDQNRSTDSYPLKLTKGRSAEGDKTGGIIPYKNRKALIGYYLGVFSAIPLPEISCPIGLVALILGTLGLRDRNRNPAIKGSLHALVGILGGGGFAILWGYFLVKKYLLS